MSLKLRTIIKSQAYLATKAHMSKTIFVFGSNLAGRHGAGGALHAKQCHGAIYGRGRGLQGNSYAIPTKDGRVGTPNLRDPAATLPLEHIKKSVDAFIEFAKTNSTWTFNVGKLGCSLACHKESDMIQLFKNAPSNCNLPEGWRK